MTNIKKLAAVSYFRNIELTNSQILEKMTEEAQ